MKEVILIRYGEIFLKGKNYLFFENTLFRNIKYRLREFDLKFQKIPGRFLISDFDSESKQNILEKLMCVFGIVSVSVAFEIDTDINAIAEICQNIQLKESTFKIETKRADKNFPLKSFEVSAQIGGLVLKNNPDKKVDVHSPKQVIFIDIRQNKKTYIFYEKFSCLGGMPVGTAGKGMLLLSGGIDSPVAGFLMAKRGLRLNAVHFFSYPYTSEQAKQKVIDLAEIIKKYTGDIRLFMVPFTKIQEAIHKQCDEEYMVILVRRFMMEIAEEIAKQNNCQAIITGENLGQVASQTVESITMTNIMSKELPIFRPLISFDKIEIANISQKIGAYETSVLPYEDCCSVFLPRNPVTHPKAEKILKNENLLERELLIRQAIDCIETIDIKS